MFVFHTPFSFSIQYWSYFSTRQHWWSLSNQARRQLGSFGCRIQRQVSQLWKDLNDFRVGRNCEFLVESRCYSFCVFVSLRETDCLQLIRMTAESQSLCVGQFSVQSVWSKRFRKRCKKYLRYKARRWAVERQQWFVRLERTNKGLEIDQNSNQCWN